MNSRISDVLHEHNRILLPIDGYQDLPVMSLDEAVQPLISLFPNNNLLTMVWTVKERCQQPADGLSQDESASIMLYTIEQSNKEHSVFFILNQTLRTEDRNKLKPWFRYLRLFLGAVLQLPVINDIVYRGVRRDLSDQYQLNTKLVWWGLSSCTDSIQTLQSEDFCGRTGSRTMFHIKCFSGRCIKRHSYYHVENEVLLLPGRYLQVRSHYNAADGLQIIQLDEIEPPHEFLKTPDSNPWRRITPGTSLLGKCTNSDCNAYRKEVIMSVEFRKFDVVADAVCVANCPICAQYVETLKLGFNKCQWRICGIKQTDSSRSPVSFSKDWSEAPRNSLFEYNPEQETTIWRQLIVETRPTNSD